jgi:hypothetical protein
MSLKMNSCYSSFLYYMPHKYTYLTRKEREYNKDNNKYTKLFFENQLCQSWDIKDLFCFNNQERKQVSQSGAVNHLRKVLCIHSFIHYKNFKPKTVIKLEWIIDGFWTDSQLL